MSNVLALNGEIAPAPTVGALQRGVLRRPVELTPKSGHDCECVPDVGGTIIPGYVSIVGADVFRIHSTTGR